MDTGLGGANDNLFFGNDFSHAVANGIEATFSRNRFVQNRVDDCWHGVWGGYSYDSTFEGNTFSGNTDGIAIEHGQNITIRHNTFSSNDTAIRLWANVSQDPDWGYPRHRDTRSRDIAITGNSFADGKVGVALLRSLRVEVAGNRYRNLATVLQTGDGVEMLAFEPPVDPGRRPVAREAEPAGAPARPPGPAARLPEGARRGRDTIIVDEWGPYDYRSPKVWPVARPADRPLRLRVLGPGGAWTIRRLSGGTTTTRSGPVPGELTVALAGRGTDLDLELDYVGAEVVTPRGVAIPAGTRVPVRYTWFDPAIDWATSFWVFDEASHPLTAPAAFADRLAQPPAHSAVLPRLDVLGSRAVGTGLPADRVALRAEATVTLPAGAYEIIVMSDDGVRVSVDGTRVIDRWSIHGTAIDRAPLAGGRRRIVVEYFEATGWAELQVRIVRRASDAGPAPREAHD
jgi:parallel beta-helix repeat protein